MKPALTTTMTIFVVYCRGPDLGPESQHYSEHARHHERGEQQCHGCVE